MDRQRLQAAFAAEKENMRLAGLYQPVVNPRTGRTRGYLYGGRLVGWEVDRICYAYGMVPDFTQVLRLMNEGRLELRSDFTLRLDGMVLEGWELDAKVGLHATN